MGHHLSVYGYHVRYGHSTKKTNDYHITESVCFSSLFSNTCNSKYYRIIILKGEADLKKYHSNFCFFTKQEIKNHLKQIPHFCKMSFNVKDIEYKNDEAFQIDFYIDSKNRTIHKYVLTWIRSLFEWPFNLYLLHAKKLQKLPQFKFESVINLFNLIATVYSHSFNSPIHTFGTSLITVNKVFPKLNYNNTLKDLPRCDLVQDFDDVNDQLYNNNLPKYLEAYKIIKNQNECNINR